MQEAEAAVKCCVFEGFLVFLYIDISVLVTCGDHHVGSRSSFVQTLTFGWQVCLIQECTTVCPSESRDFFVVG